MNSIWKSLDGVGRHLLTIGISLSSYIDLVYHGEAVNLCSGIERVDQGTSNHYIIQENEMLDMLNGKFGE